MHYVVVVLFGCIVRFDRMPDACMRALTYCSLNLVSILLQNKVPVGFDGNLNGEFLFHEYSGIGYAKRAKDNGLADWFYVNERVWINMVSSYIN